jgi:hypothetical protein
LEVPTAIGTNSATVSAQFNPGGLPSSVYFVYDDGIQEVQTSPQPIPSTNDTISTSRTLSDLSEGTIYSTRAVLSNSVQVLTSGSVYFRTLGAESEVPPVLNSLLGAAALGGDVKFAADGIIPVLFPIEFTRATSLDANGHSVHVSGETQSTIFALDSSADVTLTGITLENGSAHGAYAVNGGTLANGGAILNNGGNLSLLNCVFENNTAIGAAKPTVPGALNQPPLSSEITNYLPASANGGAIWQSGGNLVISNCDFSANSTIGGKDAPSNNTAESKGGAVYLKDGTAMILDSRFNGNMAVGGAGLVGYISGEADGGVFYFEDSSVTLSGCVIHGNGLAGSGKAIVRGGAIFAMAGSITITNTLIAMNNGLGQSYYDPHYFGSSDNSYGGALFNTGEARLLNSSVLTNTVSAGQGYGEIGDFNYVPAGRSLGGAIYNSGTLSVINCTFAGNSALETMRNEFFNTVRTNGGLGSAIFNDQSASVSNSTLAWNGVGAQAIFSTNDVLTLKNSLLASNDGANAGGDIIDAGNNLSSDSTPAFTEATSSNNIDARLGPLGLYGGSTPSFALMAGSPAINNADDSAAPATDQRGRVRPFGPHADIGSFESSPPYHVWGRIVGFHAADTTLALGTNSTPADSQGNFMLPPLPAGSYQITAAAAEALFRPNPWSIDVAADGPVSGLASYQLHTFVPDPLDQEMVFTLAGAPNEQWRIDASSDLQTWTPLGTYTIDGTGLLSVPLTNSTSMLFLRPLQP